MTEKFARSDSNHLAARANSRVVDPQTSGASSLTDANPVKDLIDQAKQVVSMIDQLQDDMGDDEFWNLPAGEWEAKNKRNTDGTPRES